MGGRIIIAVNKMAQRSIKRKRKTKFEIFL